MIRTVFEKIAPFFRGAFRPEGYKQLLREYSALPRHLTRRKKSASQRPEEPPKIPKNNVKEDSQSAPTGILASTKRTFLTARNAIERHPASVTSVIAAGAGVAWAYEHLDKKYESDAKDLHEIENNLGSIQGSGNSRRLLSGPIVRKILYELDKDFVWMLEQEVENLKIQNKKLLELEKEMYSKLNCIHTYTVSYVKGLTERIGIQKATLQFDIYCLEAVINHNDKRFTDAKDKAHDALNAAMAARDALRSEEGGVKVEQMLATAYNLLGLMYRSLLEYGGRDSDGSFELAKNYFKEAITYSKKSSTYAQAPIHHNLGFLYTAEGADQASQKEALHHHEIAHNLAPNDRGISAGYAFCLHQQGNGDEAFNVYNSNLTNNADPIILSNFAWLLLDLNCILKEKALAELACGILVKVLEEKPNHRNAVYYKGIVEAHMGNKSAAIGKLREAQKELPVHDERREIISDDIGLLKEESGQVYLKPRIERYTMNPLESRPSKEDIESCSQQFKIHWDNSQATRQRPRP